GPVHGSPKYAVVVFVHPEDKAAVDHDAQVVEPGGDGGVVPPEILALAALPEVVGGQRFEADEEAAEARFRGALDQVAAEDRADRRRALEEPAHALHPVEQRPRELLIAEQVVVEEVEVTAGKPGDFRERGVDTLGVERPTAREEGVLVAEVAVHRAAAG